MADTSQTLESLRFSGLFQPEKPHKTSRKEHFLSLHVKNVGSKAEARSIIFMHICQKTEVSTRLFLFRLGFAGS